MSETLIQIIDEHTTLCHNSNHNRSVAHPHTKFVRRYLLVDSRRQAERAAEEIGACLGTASVNLDPRGAYTVPKR